MSEDMEKVGQLIESLDKRAAELEGKSTITQEEFDGVVDGLRKEFKQLEDSSTAQQSELASSVADMEETFKTRFDELANKVRPDVDGRMLGHSGLTLAHEELVASVRRDFADAPVETAKRMTRDAYDGHFAYLQKQVAQRWGLTDVPSLDFLHRIGISASEGKVDLGQAFDDNGLERKIADMEQNVGGGNSNLFAVAVFGTSWANVLLESPLMARIPAIPMTTPTMNVPYWQDEFYQTWTVSERPLVVPYQSQDADVVLLTAQEFTKAHLIQTSVMEDSAIDIMGDVMRALEYGFMYAAEDAIVNSDRSTTGSTATGVTTGNQNINNVTTGDVAKRAFAKGLRKLAFEDGNGVINVNGNIDNDTNTDVLNRLASLLGPAGVVPGEQTYVFPINLYRKLMGVEPYSTIDKIGMAASLITGVMPSIGRAAVIWSTAYPRLTGEGGGGVASTGANNTKLSGLIFNPSLTRMGIRVPLQIARLAEGAGSDQTNFSNGVPVRARARFAFAGRPNDGNTPAGTSFGNRVAAGMYNIDA